MKNILFLVLLAVSIATLVLTLSGMNEKFSIYSLGFFLWGLMPWIFLAIITSFITHKPKLISLLVVVIIAGMLGVGILVDTLYVNLDPQGGLIFIFLPLWQLLFFVFASPFLLLFKKANLRSGGG